MILTPELRSNLEAFKRALAQYGSLTSKTLNQVLEKKGKALGIALWKGFNAHRWNQGKKPAAVLAVMFANATRLPRSAYRAGNRLTAPTGQTPVRYPANKAEPATTTDGHQMGAWRAAVTQEVMRRVAGVGVLGASFLWYRYRSNNAEGTFLVQNKSGAALGAVEKGPGFLRIVGYTPGLSFIDLKYGIISRALADETADMADYIVDALAELWGDSFTDARAETFMAA